MCYLHRCKWRCRGCWWPGHWRCRASRSPLQSPELSRSALVSANNTLINHMNNSWSDLQLFRNFDTCTFFFQKSRKITPTPAGFYLQVCFWHQNNHLKTRSIWNWGQSFYSLKISRFFFNNFSSSNIDFWMGVERCYLMRFQIPLVFKNLQNCCLKRIYPYRLAVHSSDGPPLPAL